MGLLCLALSGCRGPEANAQPGPGARFDYFVLALSWAPDFCAHSAGRGTSRECDPARHVGFVVHGLWPQRDYGRPLEDCAPVRPVSSAIVESMLPLMPDRGLIQHEWRAHGSCTDMPPREYFGLVRRAFAGVRLPREFSAPDRTVSLSVSRVENEVERDSGLPAGSVRLACREGQLSELRICFSKDLSGRPCSESVRECRAGQVTVLPVE